MRLHDSRSLLPLLMITLITCCSHAEETVVLPIAPHRAAVWRYTFTDPGENWHDPDYNDAAWKQGRAGFGTRSTPKTTVNTEWNTKDIWLRTEFDYDGRAFANALQKRYRGQGFGGL